MEGLKRFDIAEFNDTLMVVVESEILPPDPAVVVIPLLQGYPAVQHLNPTISLGGTDYVLATRLITSVRRNALRFAGDAKPEADKITRAIDVLLSGV